MYLFYSYPLPTFINLKAISHDIEPNLGGNKIFSGD